MKRGVGIKESREEEYIVGMREQMGRGEKSEQWSEYMNEEVSEQERRGEDEGRDKE